MQHYYRSKTFEVLYILISHTTLKVYFTRMLFNKNNFCILFKENIFNKKERFMNTIFQINSDELDNRFIESIKALFKSKKIIISVSEDIDETSYLLQSDNNARRLFDALDDVRQNKNLITVNSIDELETLVDNAKNSSN